MITIMMMMMMMMMICSSVFISYNLEWPNDSMTLKGKNSPRVSVDLMWYLELSRRIQEKKNTYDDKRPQFIHID